MNSSRVPIAMLRGQLRERLKGRRVSVPVEQVAVGDTIAYWGVGGLGGGGGGRFAIVTRVHPRLREVRVAYRVRISGTVYVLWKDTVHESQITENLGRRRSRDLAPRKEVR